MLRSKQSRAYWFLLDGGSTAVYCALQLPNPMFAFAFEGELLAFIVSGDRFVLLALLPRRKPRTTRTVQPPYHCVKELSTSPARGYSDSRVLLAAGMDFCFIDAVPHLHTMPAIPCLGFTRQKKPRPPHHRDDLGFRFFHPPTALRRYLHPSFQSGPRCRAGFRFRPSLRSGGLRFLPFGGSARAAPFGRGFSFLFGMSGVTRFARDGRLR